VLPFDSRLVWNAKASHINAMQENNTELAEEREQLREQLRKQVRAVGNFNGAAPYAACDAVLQKP
jgi:hypothetical protein